MTWLLALAAVGLLLGLDRYAALNPRDRAVFLAGCFTIIAWRSLAIYEMVAGSAANPPQWDFLSFWAFAKVGASGLDIYEPAHFLALDLPRSVSGSFRQAILEVGFWYPPPSMLLLLPLAWIDDPRLGYVAANLVLSVAFGATVYLLWRHFFRNGVAGLVATTGLVLLLPATFSNYRFTQTNVLVLVAVLAVWSVRDRWIGGAGLAAGVLVKPYLAIVFLSSLIQRRWRTLGGALAASIPQAHRGIEGDLADGLAFESQTLRPFVIRSWGWSKVRMNLDGFERFEPALSVRDKEWHRDRPSRPRTRQPFSKLVEIPLWKAPGGGPRWRAVLYVRRDLCPTCRWPN